MTQQVKNFIYKICVVGDGGVGKTSMVLRYCENTFKDNYIMTIGSNFSTKTVDLPDHPELSVKLQIWDLAGQKHFSFVRPPFYRGATAIIFCMDLTRRSSFQNLPAWKEEVEKVVGPKPSILVGNKLDLIISEDKREVSTEEGKALMAELGAERYFEGSARTGLQVEDLFKEMVLIILRQSGKIS